MRKYKYVFFTIAAALAVGAYAIQDAAKIVWKPRAGSVMKYRISSVADMGGQKMEFGAVMTQKVVEIKSDGNVVISNSTSDITLKVGDQDMSGMMPADMAPVITTVMGPDGSLVSRTLSKPSEMDTPRLDYAMVLIYPSADMKAGDTWSRKFAGDKAKGIPPSTTTFTYKGKEMVADKFDTHKVMVEFKETEGAAPMSLSGHVWLKTDDGAMLKAEGTLKNFDVGQGMPPFDMTNKIIRISSEGG